MSLVKIYTEQVLFKFCYVYLLPGGLVWKLTARVPKLQHLLWLGGKLIQNIHQQETLRKLKLWT